jgi:tetratricopeptide (TPR) repeat protein/CHAT domain-containing protein/NADH/NAD ratio-sensing transcriptional regulator Rex
MKASFFSTILDFQVRPLAAETYSLTICERNLAQPPSSQQLVSATFSHRVDFLTDFSVDRLNTSAEDPAVRFDELQRLGRELYQKLFPPELEQIWNEYKQRHEFLILCLRFSETAMKLEVLPWETLHDGTEFIAAGLKTTITRLPLNLAQPSDLPPIERPLKLFALFSSPLDLQDHERLNIEHEQEILLEAINDPAAQGRISADFEDEAKLEILERSLRDSYHILHFTGHGISPHDGGGLLLEDAHGNKLAASIAEVMQAVTSGVDRLRLAVMSGCQTARTLNTGAFSDLARELLRQCVPAVIAMQFSITDEGGLRFAEVLYSEIARGVELERAVHAARRILLKDERFFINNDALAIVLLTGNGACLKTTEGKGTSPEVEPGTAYFGDTLDPLPYGFYGRRREYREIRDALLHQDQNAVIIHGIGGIGKTALLTYAFNRLRSRFKDVMSFDCRRAALAPETILLELHRYFAAQGMPQLQPLIGQNVPPETLANYIVQMLTQWPLLIVFDNFETQLDEQRKITSVDLCVFLTTLVQATASDSRFLFTTRYLFNLDGSGVGNVQALPLGDLSRAEAVMLMQKLPNLSKATYPDKQAVLENFGGHPYALIALDRHCSNRPLDQALQDVSSLKSELREFLAIELNYRRLSDKGRELLNRIAVFRQPIPLEAAEWMIGEKVPVTAESLPRFLDLLPENIELDNETLQQMLESSLLTLMQPTNVNEPIRELIELGLVIPHLAGSELESLSIHSLVRDFCNQKQDADLWRGRLFDAAKFYMNLTDSAKEYDQTPEMARKAMEAFDLLMDGKHFEAAAPILFNYSSILKRWGFWHYLEFQHRRLLNEVDHQQEVEARINLGALLQHRGEYDAALAEYNRASGIAREIGYLEGIAESSGKIGLVHEQRGNYQEAVNHYQDAIKVFEEADSGAGIAKWASQVGVIHHRLGRYDEALTQYQVSLTSYEDRGDLEGTAEMLHLIGTLFQVRGESEEAIQYYAKSLKIREAINDVEGRSKSLNNLGIITLDRGEYEEALEYFRSALEIKEFLGDRAGIARAQLNIGRIYQARGNWKEALDQYRLSLNIQKTITDREGAAYSLGQIGEVLVQTGSYSEAFRVLFSALNLFAQLQIPNAGNVVRSFRELRANWGEEAFDAAWREATSDDVPVIFKSEPTAEE